MRVPDTAHWLVTKYAAFGVPTPVIVRLCVPVLSRMLNCFVRTQTSWYPLDDTLDELVELVLLELVLLVLELLVLDADDVEDVDDVLLDEL